MPEPSFVHSIRMIKNAQSIVANEFAASEMQLTFVRKPDPGGSAVGSIHITPTRKKR
jgi:hypothetical protein